MSKKFSIENILINIFIILLSLSLTFGIGELSAWFYITNFMNEEQFMRYASFKQFKKRYSIARQSDMYSPHRYLGYYTTPNYVKAENRHNSLGFRGEEIPLEKKKKTIRIVCLGGSTTYGAVKDYRDSYPYLLEQKLKELVPGKQIEVINAGVSSYTTWESLINLQFRVLPLKPDIIIIYHGINDIHSRIVWPHESYKADNSGERLANVVSIRIPHIIEYSNLCRFLLINLNISQPQNSLDFTLIDRPATFYADLHTQQYLTNSYPDGIFKEVSAMTMIEQNKPVYFESNIRSMVAIAKANNIKPVLVTFAHSALFPEHPRVSSPEYLKGYEEHNAVIRSLKDIAPVYDLEHNMPDARANYSDGRHFTKEGNMNRAELIAKYLTANNIVK